MRVKSTTKQSDNKYTATFDDNMILTIQIQEDGTWKYISQCAIGLDNYYIKNGKYFTGWELEDRIKMAADKINLMQNRYKKNG